MKRTVGVLSEDTAKNAIKMRQYFLVPDDINHKLEQLENVGSELCIQFRQPVSAFCSAISATHQSTSISYLLANSKANALQYQRFHMAERIRQIPIKPPPEDTAKELSEEAERKAIDLANERFLEFQNSDDGLNIIVSDICSTLLEALNDPITKKASNELLYQSLVSVWSAFEVLVRDVCTIALNHFPHLSVKILCDPSCKKHFELQKLSIDDLSQAEYNFSNKMGDLILGSRDLSDLRAIKLLLVSLLNDSSLAEVLNDRQLWFLNQDRHLIVHRRGMIDKKYKQATGTTSKIGEIIVVSPFKLDIYFDTVIKSAGSILSTFAATEFA